MTLEQFILWEAGIGIPMLVAFCAWLVVRGNKIEVKVAEQSAKFVTWEHMNKVDQWRSETTREFSEVRKELQAVALAVARLEGAGSSHTGG